MPGRPRSRVEALRLAGRRWRLRAGGGPPHALFVHLPRRSELRALLAAHFPPLDPTRLASAGLAGRQVTALCDEVAPGTTIVRPPSPHPDLRHVVVQAPPTPYQGWPSSTPKPAPPSPPPRPVLLPKYRYKPDLMPAPPRPQRVKPLRYWQPGAEFAQRLLPPPPPPPSRPSGLVGVYLYGLRYPRLLEAAAAYHQLGCAWPPWVVPVRLEGIISGEIEPTPEERERLPRLLGLSEPFVFQEQSGYRTRSSLTAPLARPE